MRRWLGVKGTARIDVTSPAGPEVDASVLGVLACLTVVFFDLVILYKKEYDESA